MITFHKYESSKNDIKTLKTVIWYKTMIPSSNLCATPGVELTLANMLLGGGEVSADRVVAAAFIVGRLTRNSRCYLSGTREELSLGQARVCRRSGNTRPRAVNVNWQGHTTVITIDLLSSV